LEVTQLAGGGKLEDINLLNATPETALDQYSSGVFSMHQPLEDATNGSSMEMSLSASLVDVEPGSDLVFKVDAGCIGETTFEIWNAMDTPFLVKSITWANPCDGSAGIYKVPVDLFIKDAGRLSDAGITLPLPRSSYEWHFDEDVEGWGIEFENDISAPSVEDGHLTFTMTGEDPYLYSPANLRIDAESTPIISIRMKVQEGELAGFFFIPEGGEENEETKVDFPLIKDAGIFTYDVDMSVNPLWRGTITQLRFDPVQGGGFVPQQIEIEYIVIHAP
jgi:hypothetical protein